MNPTPRFQVRVGGLCVERGHVLLTRGAGDEFWTLPGGRVVAGEETAGALRREMLEELDLFAEVRRLIWVIENFFVYRGRACHELGFIFELGLAFEQRAGAPLCETLGSPFHGAGEERRLEFVLHPIDRLRELVLKPSFLYRGIPEPPVALTHRVVRDLCEDPG